MSDFLGIMSLLNPRMAERIQKQENDYRVERCRRGGLKKWDEILNWGDAYIDADSFVQAEDHLVGKVKDKPIVVHNGKVPKTETRRWMETHIQLDRLLLPAETPIRFSTDEDNDW